MQTAGFSAFWVGGCVRDFLLGREPQDYDIATSARPEQVEKLFQHTVPVGKKFGVMIVLEDGHQFQVATFRAEADYQDGRHPEQVTFANAEADAQRRDFTVNGLFYDPVAEKIHDWVGGEKDLRAKIIRTIGRAGGTVCRGPFAPAARGAVCRATGFCHRAANLCRHPTACAAKSNSSAPSGSGTN